MSFLAILCLISTSAAFPASKEIAQTNLPAPLTNDVIEKNNPLLDPTKEATTPKDFNENNKNVEKGDDSEVTDQSHTNNNLEKEHKDQYDSNSNFKEEKENQVHNSDEKYHIENHNFDHKTKEEQKDSNKYHVEHNYYFEFVDKKANEENRYPKPENHEQDSDEDENDQPVPVIIKIEDGNTRSPILSIISWLYCHWPSFPLSFKINEPQYHEAPLYISDVV